MSTTYEQRASGLVVPQSKPTKPPRKYGVMELQCDDQRKEAAAALQKLFHITGWRMSRVPEDVRKAQRRLVESVIVELLGEDAGFLDYT